MNRLVISLLHSVTNWIQKTHARFLSSFNGAIGCLKMAGTHVLFDGIGAAL